MYFSKVSNFLGKKHNLIVMRRILSRTILIPILIVAVGCLFFPAGCSSDKQALKNMPVKNYRPSGSHETQISTKNPGLQYNLSRAIDSLDLDQSAPAGQVALASPAVTSIKGGAKLPAANIADAIVLPDGPAVPAEATKMIPMPKLSSMEVNEITDQLVMHMGAQLNYVDATGTMTRHLPDAPKGIIGDKIIAKKGQAGTQVIRFGYRHYVSQPSQLWIMGVIIDQAGKMTPNPDADLIAPEITKIIDAMNKMRSGLTVRDLEAKLVQLSYVDADMALSMLTGLGITTVPSPDKIPPKVEFAKLPYVVKVQDPDKQYTGLIGAKTATSGSKLSLSPGVASDMADNALASPMSQLLVMFHPAHPEQFSDVRKALDEFIDRPARQIFIEGMVLEISEDGLKELGVEWELNEAPITLTGGSLNAGTSTDTVNLKIANSSLLHNVFKKDFQWDWDLTIRALVRSGQAEILSRPSVLTLNNRQSTIRVGRDIPIASSLEGLYSSNKVSFNFVYLPTGILLNIRPRINEDGSEVSMMIDTIVSAKVPGADLEMRAQDSTLLASAPTVSTRRVQTYGRIANNTPLIIGGLVASEDTVTKDKVPLLGDIPIAGAAFRSEKTQKMKREVIIVLTPHVLPDKKEVRRSYPKDEDSFDNFGHDLFRDSYRIRGEDVFDLTFLLENQRIANYRSMARQVAGRNFRIGEEEPFKSFVHDSIPGESILVTRMIYEVIKRLHIEEPIDQSRIIYFGQQKVGGYDVKFLDGIITDERTGKIKDFGDKALAIIYHYDRDSLQAGRLGSEPIPEISMIDCPDSETWTKKLWELNQPEPDGRKRHTIIIKSESDITRLRRALALKRIATLNGGEEHMRLKNFSVGKVLLMPELKENQIHVIDADTARYFFHTELYYAATLAEIEKQLKQLDKMLRQSDMSVLLDHPMPDGDISTNGK